MNDLKIDLRDYFAAKADVSLYTPLETFELARGRKPTITELAKYIAEIRMIEADAMLTERAKNAPQADDDGWIEWNGQSNSYPVNSETSVEVTWIKYEGSDIGEAKWWNWDAVKSYRLVK